MSVRCEESTSTTSFDDGTDEGLDGTGETVGGRETKGVTRFGVSREIEGPRSTTPSKAELFSSLLQSESLSLPRRDSYYPY